MPGKRSTKGIAWGAMAKSCVVPAPPSNLRKLTADQRARASTSSFMEGKGQMPPWQGTLNQNRGRSALGLHPRQLRMTSD